MFVRVPIAYYEDVVLKGRRKVESVLFGEWVEVNVVEADDSDAPVATRWQETGARAEMDALHGINETRWFDGRHFTPALYQASGKAAEAVGLSRMLRDCENGYSYANPLVGGYDWQVQRFVEGKTKPLADTEIRVRHTRNREEAIEEAHQRASNVLVVRGEAGEAMVWTADDEPVYKVDESRGWHSDYIWVGVAGAGAMANPSPNVAVFRADRFDDMQDHVSKLQEGGRPIGKLPHIHVLIPESIRYDDETPGFLAAARTSVDWGKSDLAERPLEEIVAWARLRDVLKEAEIPGGRQPEHLAALEQAMRDYQGTKVAFRDPRGYRDHHIELMDRALDRWSLRPLAIGHEELPKLGYGSR